MHSRVSNIILCGLAGIALTLPLAAQNTGSDPGVGVVVNFNGTVSAIREVAAGKPLEGIHADVKADGRTFDVYIAPTGFARKYGATPAKGSELHIVGTQTKVGGSEVVLAREITSGYTDARTGRFHANLTVYLRNDDGPMWLEYETVTEPRPVSAH
jgi:hypothetical protein